MQTVAKYELHFPFRRIYRSTLLGDVNFAEETQKRLLFLAHIYLYYVTYH